jgi:hypothetical protein
MILGDILHKPKAWLPSGRYFGSSRAQFYGIGGTKFWSSAIAALILVINVQCDRLVLAVEIFVLNLTGPYLGKAYRRG